MPCPPPHPPSPYPRQRVHVVDREAAPRLRQHHVSPVLPLLLLGLHYPGAAPPAVDVEDADEAAVDEGRPLAPLHLHPQHHPPARGQRTRRWVDGHHRPLTPLPPPPPHQRRRRHRLQHYCQGPHPTRRQPPRSHPVPGQAGQLTGAEGVLGGREGGERGREGGGREDAFGLDEQAGGAPRGL